jgi:uncharacterized iron-regulated protein
MFGWANWWDGSPLEHLVRFSARNQPKLQAPNLQPSQITTNSNYNQLKLQPTQITTNSNYNQLKLQPTQITTNSNYNQPKLRHRRIPTNSRAN